MGSSAVSPPSPSLLHLTPSQCCILIGLLGGSIYGYNTGIIGGLNTPLVVGTFFFDPDYPLDGTEVSSKQSWLEGVLTASILVGGFIGSFLGPVTAQHFGRLRALQLCGVIGTAAPIGMAIVESYVGLVLLRTLLGVSVGIAGAVGPLYVNEMAPPHRRGMLGTVFQIAVCASIFIAEVVNFAFNPSDDHASQRYLEEWKWHDEFLLGFIPCALLVIATFFVPESSNWRPIDTQLDVPQGGPQQLPLETSNAAMEQRVNSDLDLSAAARSPSPPSPSSSSTSPWSHLFSAAGCKWLFIGFILSTINQLTGINSVIFYAPKIFSDAGLSNTLILQFSVVGSWNLMAVFISFALVDRVGRRILMLGSLAVMAFALGLLGLSYVAFPDQKSVVAIICIILYIGAFECGPGPLFFLMAVETFPSHLQRQCLSFANALAWTFNILVSMLFPVVTEAITAGGTFFMFGGITVVAIVLTYFFLPETKDNHGKHIDGESAGRSGSVDTNGSSSPYNVLTDHA